MLTRYYPLLKLIILLLSALAMAMVANQSNAAEAGAQVGSPIVPDDPAPMSDDDVVTAVEDYFNAIDTLTADFFQLAPDSSLSEGRVFISRPGLLRVEYDPPVEFLIIGDGRWLNMIDYELKDISRWSIDDTPLKVLVKADLDLRKDVRLRSIEQDAGLVRVTVSSPDVPGNERISFLFTQNPFELRQWEVADGSGQVTRVALTNTVTNVDLPRDTFQYEDPRSNRRVGPRR